MHTRYASPMRPSPLRHPLAILRITIGLTQKEMGALVKRAARTIQSIELGKLPLCEDLALAIAEATGVDESWLFKGDTSAPPEKGMTLIQAGRGAGVYTRADYEYHRAYLEAPLVTGADLAEACRKADAEGKDEVDISVMGLDKGKVLGKQAEWIQLIDQGLTLRFRLILGLTALTNDMRLARWKIRRFLGELVEEFKLDVPEVGVTIEHLRLAGVPPEVLAEAKAAKAARERQADEGRKTENDGEQVRQ
jgi:transcriptional regulator with XRE-family HTH domain